MRPGPDGQPPSVTWRPLRADDQGLFTSRALLGGYAWFGVTVAQAGIWRLEATGHSLVYVNGVARTGDPYSTGAVGLPVALVAGHNDLLFAVPRGRLRWQFVPVEAQVVIDSRDATLPHVVRADNPQDRPSHLWAAVVVSHNRDQTLPAGRLALRVTTTGGRQLGLVPLPALPPLSVRKVPVRFETPRPDELPPPPLQGSPAKLVTTPLVFEVVPHTTASAKTSEPADLTKPSLGQPVTLALPVASPGELQNRTFVSDIDGSVQYYAVLPAPWQGNAPPPAIVLSLHGAGVEATGQAASYAAKPWAHIVAPTNRRPFGFDWEEWGRLDALEVLNQAQRDWPNDPARVFLTGHSMGGHGSWHLAVTTPDRFAAVGPSAGWISFQSYAASRGGSLGRDGSPVEKMLARAAAASQTLTLATNLSDMAVYGLHGDADDNVPIGQMRAMREQLAMFHRDHHWHEQPGAGHWWDASDEPGVDCVDWADMFALFARRRLASDQQTRRVHFTTVCPGVSSRCRWVTVVQQREPLIASRVEIRCDPGRRRFMGTTANVRRLSLSTGHLAPGQTVTVDLDGSRIENIPDPKSSAAADAGGLTGTQLHLLRGDAGWLVVANHNPAEKSPDRAGLLRSALTRRFILVYGSAGTPAETAANLARARLDAETFWVRGNGSVDVVADHQAGDVLTADPHRNVVVYGHADNHALWNQLLADSPVQVRRGLVTAGSRRFEGDDLAVLTVRPRPGSDTASVAVITGSGFAGLRLTERMPLFVSGAGLPDLIITRAAMLDGSPNGIVGLGFYGHDWKLDSGSCLWP